MIKLNNYIVTPTIFPDQTSQVWKLPDNVLNADKFTITWFFENEAELMTLLSLRKLLILTWKSVELFIPYLPYARQDKILSNNDTFNLSVFAKLIRLFEFSKITAIDVHNQSRCNELFYNFYNFKVNHLHEELFYSKNIDYIVYPDEGAYKRYHNDSLKGYVNTLVGQKLRDPSTGHIALNGWKLVNDRGDTMKCTTEGQRFLIVDDICDGGATFIEIAKKIREEFKNPYIVLFVTHGLFSKGKQVLYDAGINEVLTTNTLLRNSEEGIKIL